MSACNTTCPTTTSSFGTVHKANVDRFRLIFEKDSLPWDLTLGSVTIYFKAPDRTTVKSFAMTAEDASEGIFYYDTAITDLTVAGSWLVGAKVVDGAIIKNYPFEISLTVTSQP